VTTIAPERILSQRLAALSLANETRSERARLKRELKAGRITVLPLLLEPPDWLETMRAFDLLLAMPKWGRVKVRKLLDRECVSPSKTVGGLSDRQRHCIAQALIDDGARIR
jgi:S13-like H2TH domain